MYIRTTTYAYNPAQADELLQLNDEHLIPRLRQLPGFVSYTYGLDPETRRGISITVGDVEHLDHPTHRLAVRDRSMLGDAENANRSPETGDFSLQL